MQRWIRWGLPLGSLLAAHGAVQGCWSDHVPEGVPAAGGSGGSGGGAGGGAPPSCGDGTPQDPEECDDGNRVDADGCEADCTLPRCDNGIVDPGELCFVDPYVAVETQKERADDLVLLDCDGDCDLDAITADAASGSITVLRNDGTGALGQRYHQDTGLGLANGVEVHALLAGQFDLQPATDLLVTGSFGGNSAFGILSGADDCGFASFAVETEIAPPARDAALADLDGGARDDVVFALTSGATSELEHYIFESSTLTPTTTSALEATALAAGDLDGDGDDDVLFVDAAGDAMLVAENDGGTFTVHAPIAVGAEPWSIALGDLDDDGALDAVTANRTADTVSVLLGDGALAFTRQTPDVAIQRAGSLTPASAPAAIALADLDGDGDLDAATANSDGSSSRSSVTILLNDGTGALTIAEQQALPPIAADAPIEVGLMPTTIRLADLNGDGAPDIITASPFVDAGTSHVSVLLTTP
jgi:cysteine-rich repeat protein